jgi:hypothetical protein
VIHLERVALPDGLRAVAYRDARGNLVIYVSQTLDAPGQRAAVVAAIRASRRGRWRVGLPSAGIVLLLGIRTMLGNAAGALRARPLAWGAAATATVLGASAAAVLITAVPYHRAPPEAAPRPAPHSALAPRPQPSHPPARASHLTQARRAPAATASPAPGRLTGPGRPSPGPAPTGGSSPGPSTPSPTPTKPTPSPSPSRSHSPPPSLICVVLLGIRVCV